MSPETSKKVSQSGPFFRHLMESESKIFAFILAIVHNDADAKDIMQETLVIMWEQFSHFDPQASFIGWGIGIAKNVTYTYLRKHRTSRMIFSTDLLEDVARVTADKADRDDGRIESLRECLGKLNQNEFDLLKKRYGDNMTTKSIALAAGISMHRMYYMMARIHRVLQLCLRRSFLSGEGL